MSVRITGSKLLGLCVLAAILVWVTPMLHTPEVEIPDHPYAVMTRSQVFPPSLASWDARWSDAFSTWEVTTGPLESMPPPGQHVLRAVPMPPLEWKVAPIQLWVSKGHVMPVYVMPRHERISIPYVKGGADVLGLWDSVLASQIAYTADRPVPVLQVDGGLLPRLVVRKIGAITYGWIEVGRLSPEILMTAVSTEVTQYSPTKTIDLSWWGYAPGQSRQFIEGGWEDDSKAPTNLWVLDAYEDFVLPSRVYDVTRRIWVTPKERVTASQKEGWAIQCYAGTPAWQSQAAEGRYKLEMVDLHPLPNPEPLQAYSSHQMASRDLVWVDQNNRVYEFGRPYEIRRIKGDSSYVQVEAGRLVLYTNGRMFVRTASGKYAELWALVPKIRSALTAAHVKLHRSPYVDNPVLGQLYEPAWIEIKF